MLPLSEGVTSVRLYLCGTDLRRKEPCILVENTTIAGNVRHYIAVTIFHKNPVKWKYDNNDGGRVG